MLKLAYFDSTPSKALVAANNLEILTLGLAITAIVSESMST